MGAQAIIFFTLDICRPSIEIWIMSIELSCKIELTEYLNFLEGPQLKAF